MCPLVVSNCFIASLTALSSNGSSEISLAASDKLDESRVGDGESGIGELGGWGEVESIGEEFT